MQSNTFKKLSVCVGCVVALGVCAAVWYRTSSAEPPLFCDVWRRNDYSILPGWHPRPPVFDNSGDVVYFDVHRNLVVYLQARGDSAQLASVKRVNGGDVTFEWAGGNGEEVPLAVQRDLLAVFPRTGQPHTFALPAGAAVQIYQDLSRKSSRQVSSAIVACPQLPREMRLSIAKMLNR